MGCSSARRALAALAFASAALAQGDLLTVAPPQKIALKRGGTAESRLVAQLRQGYHVNSNTPADEYLIPLRLTWAAGPIKPVESVFPKPELRNYEFSNKPVSVFTGDFEILTRFQAGATAPAGPGVLGGKLRYQACSHDRCFPPRTVEIKLPYSIR
jgi:hypothetical protein